MLKQVKYVDKLTGEVLRKRQNFYPTAFDEEKGYLFWARKNACRSFHDIDFPKELSDVEIGRLAKLSKRIWSNTNMLGYRGNGGIQPYNVAGIAQVIGCQERQARRFIDKMMDLGLIAKVKTEVAGMTQTQYYLNPLYFSSSNRIPLNLYLIFKPHLDEYLPTWVIRRYSQQTGKN